MYSEKLRNIQGQSRATGLELKPSFFCFQSPSFLAILVSLQFKPYLCKSQPSTSFSNSLLGMVVQAYKPGTPGGGRIKKSGLALAKQFLGLSGLHNTLSPHTKTNTTH